MITPDYYYVIVGGGLAGLQLASRISQDIFFKGKKIAIIDPLSKSIEDKTWCYWEKGKGNWDDLTIHSWKKAGLFSSEIEKITDLGEYSYKMLSSIDFNEAIKKQLQLKEEFIFIEDEVEKIDPVTRTAIGKNGSYTATHFFDSRPDPGYMEHKKYSMIHQHFKGWMIETEKEHFDPSMFTMMDFRIGYKNATCFTYVLPLSPKKALVEYTFFTPFLTEEDVYDKQLEKYLKQVLKIQDYRILGTESGNIPMTDFPFEEQNSDYITKIGTGGGWVKASSGYSFKNSEKKIDQLIENIKSGHKPSYRLLNKRFRKYDAIFLHVLLKRNDLGEDLFMKLYTRNSIQDIFRFLDEETRFSEDIKIMKSLFHPQFMKSFFKKI
ncbi:lycopene cyclase family protein [Gramella sp. GC03-9]|uniref:Lycopene cyclase family protein n=1 Tax=Christiangramia oceanisediminis TaxID=2920386 RepID=A0A9X2KZR5_9FLAO|nr:lycopene cyclase family protein [Gramella oceanisediminis]MCP9201201.1 lycopene cyclase family protein [Gramella oceanisediminis]